MRLEIIKDYINEKVKVEISHSQARQILPYLTMLKDGAYALPITRDIPGVWDKVEVNLCAVFPASLNSNKRLETERLLGGAILGFKGLGYDNITSELSFQELNLFSLYHEIAHCLDNSFFYENIIDARARQAGAQQIHQAEGMAETMAYFLLLKDYPQLNYESLALDRAKLRTIYSRKVGGYLANNPHLGFGDPNVSYGGAIYYLTPFLLKAKNIAGQFSPETLNDLSYEKIHATSTDIVNQEHINSRAMFPIREFLKGEDLDELINTYEQRAIDSPHLFADTIDVFRKYLSQTEEILNLAIRDRDLVHIPKSIDQNLDPIDYLKFCDLLKSNDKVNFNKLINQYREELALLAYEKNATDTNAQSKRSKELNTLHSHLANTCRD